MTSKILDETGYFWWSVVPVAQNELAPEVAVAGRLIIHEDGQSSLELEGVLPNSHGPLAAIVSNGSQLPADKRIHGILKTSNKTVRLSQLRRNGGQFKSNGISFERYAAFQCLLGDGPFRDFAEPLVFDRLYCVVFFYSFY